MPSSGANEGCLGYWPICPAGGYAGEYIGCVGTIPPGIAFRSWYMGCACIIPLGCAYGSWYMGCDGIMSRSGRSGIDADCPNGA
eukprot:3067657-Rhodomonas_salina.3